MDIAGKPLASALEHVWSLIILQHESIDFKTTSQTPRWSLLMNTRQTSQFLLMTLTATLIISLNPFGFSSAQAITPIRIEVGKDYEGYSNEELRRRVWQLERAVSQLQDQVFELAIRDGSTRINIPTTAMWTCTIQSFGKTHVSTGMTKAAAQADALRKCSDATNAIHCHDSDVKCGNE